MTTHTPGRVPEMLRANLTNEEFVQLVIEAENLRADLRACKAISTAMEGAAHDLTVQRDELLKALKASLGYMKNASIDLQVGAPKRTALNTLNGGITLIEDAIAKASQP